MTEREVDRGADGEGGDARSVLATAAACVAPVRDAPRSRPDGRVPLAAGRRTREWSCLWILRPGGEREDGREAEASEEPAASGSLGSATSGSRGSGNGRRKRVAASPLAAPPGPWDLACVLRLR